MNAIAQAKQEAGKRVLLQAVRACNWNLSRAGKRLRIKTCADVIRYLYKLAPEEYRDARAAGLVQRGGDMRKAGRAP